MPNTSIGRALLPLARFSYYLRLNGISSVSELALWFSRNHQFENIFGKPIQRTVSYNRKTSTIGYQVHNIHTILLNQSRYTYTHTSNSSKKNSTKKIVFTLKRKSYNLIKNGIINFKNVLSSELCFIYFVK